MRKFITNNILLLSILVFASQAIYAQNWDNVNWDSIQKIRDSISANTKPKGGGGGIGPMSVNPNPPAGSIAVNRNTKYQSMSPAQLIQDIFVRNGACATVDNVNVSIYGWNNSTSSNGATGSWADILNNRGFAYFDKGTSNFPIAEGLVMSTGNVRDTEGRNSSDAALGGGINNGSDADLRGLTTHNIMNHCRIEFDFVPTSHVIEFRYIFASEEYPEYVNSQYNDVFGFFVNDVTNGVIGPKTNIAKLPSTGTGNYNVTVNNVNDGGWTSNAWQTRGGYGAAYPVSNSNFFVRNTNTSYVTEMDGYTTVLTATYNVTPCRKYRLKLVIGNASDQILGSAVFLEARSFDVGRDLEFYGNNILGNDYIFKGCETNYFDVTRTINTSQAATIQVTHSNTGGATNGTHYTAPNGSAVSTNVDFNANETTKRIYLKATDDAVPGSYFTLAMRCPCAESDVAISKNIYIYDFVESFDASPTSSCSSNANGKITISANGTSGKYEYSLNNVTWQTSNVFSGLSPGTYTVYVRDIGSCKPPLSKQVTIQNLTANAGPNINNCNSNVFTLAASPLGTGETGKWTRVSGGSVTFTNDTQYNTKVTLNSGTTANLLWTVSNGNCSSADNVDIINNALPTAPPVTTPVSYCLGATASPLSVSSSGYTLNWYDANDGYLGTTAPTPSTAVAGSTIYKVSRVNTSTGCESPKSSITVNVKAQPTATISGPSVLCEENTQISLTFSLTGQSLWTVNYTERDLNTSQETLRSFTSTTPTRIVTVTPTEPHSYEYIITKVSDGNGCVSEEINSIKVQFQPCGFKSPMLLWLKANDGPYIDPSNTFEWRDQSQAFNIDQEAKKDHPFDQIVWQNSAINFNQSVKFDGTSGQYLSGTVLNNDGFSVKSTLFTVTEPATVSSKAVPQGIFSTRNTTNVGQGLFFNKSSGTPFYVMGGAVLDGTSSLHNQGSANINYPILLRGTYPDSVTTENTEFWDNGIYVGKKTSAPFNTYPAKTPNFDVGGSGVSPGNVFDGKIAEIIYFHDLLSVNEADKVESYLAIKYGISLTKSYLASNGTTIIWDYNGNPTFKTHIAGIGRDNGYALDQRVSHNTSPGDMVTVAHNPSSFITDQTLASSITVDKSYLVWASNNGAKSFGSPDNSSGNNVRLLNRKWRVKKTGTVGNVSMQFDTTGISIPSGWGRKPALVVTPQPNFSGSFTYYKAEPGYPNPTYHNVVLPEGYHFTLVLTEGVTAEAGPDQSACSNDAGYEFTMAANAYETNQAGKWEIVSEPATGTVTVLNPSLNTSKVRLAVAGTAVLRWVVWNTFSMDSDTSYVNITRHAMPDMPVDMTLPAVCPGAGNDSIVINSSNSNYLYTVYTTPTDGTPIASGNGTGGKITIKPGNKITVPTCYYIEIQHTVTQCYGTVRWKVCIPVYADMVQPDIRIKVCPNPAYNLDLRTYLNSSDIVNYTFTSPISSLLTNGYNIYTGNLSPGSTYTLRYSVTGHCRSGSAKMYILALNTNQALPVPKQVKICQQVDLAQHVQLQQILGVDVAGGAWVFDPTISPLSDYVTTVNGAYLFNAQKAWLDNKGLAVGSDRHFTFDYYINGSMCIPNGIYRLTVIVTENM